MSVTGVVMPSPLFVGLDASGNPLSGGLLYTYVPGSTTNQLTYSDSALSVTNANPVILDSAGRATVYCDPSLGYKFLLKNAAGTTQYTQDNAFLPSSVLPVVLSKVFANSPYTVTSADGFDVLIACDCTGGAMTIAPYTAIGNAGKRITVVKTDSSANAVTIDPNGSQTWGGAATEVLSTQYASSAAASDNANWIKTAGLGPPSTPIQLGAGTVGAPPYSFAADTNTGLFRSAADTLQLVTGGVAAVTLDSTQFLDSATQPRCVAFHSATQTVTAGNTTALTLDSEDLDVGTLHDTVTNNSRITIPTGGDGLYLITGQSLSDNGGNAAYTADLKLKKNGTTFLVSAQIQGASNIAVRFMTLQVSGLFALAAADYVELYGQATSSNITFGSSTAGYATRVNVVKLW